MAYYKPKDLLKASGSYSLSYLLGTDFAIPFAYLVSLVHYCALVVFCEAPARCCVAQGLGNGAGC